MKLWPRKTHLHRVWEPQRLWCSERCFNEDVMFYGEFLGVYLFVQLYNYDTICCFMRLCTCPHWVTRFQFNRSSRCFSMISFHINNTTSNDHVSHGLTSKVVEVKMHAVLHTVHGRNPANQLRLVVYPSIYKVFCIPGGSLGFLNHQQYPYISTR